MNADGDTPLVATEFKTSSNNRTVGNEAAAQASSKDATGILYKIEWEDDDTEARQNFESQASFGDLDVATENEDRQGDGDAKSEKRAPLEVVTVVWGRTDSNVTKDKSKEDSADAPETKAKRVGFKNVKISKVGQTRMIIRDQPLLEIIRTCVTYYPGTPLIGDEIVLAEPYGVLIHHFGQLETSRAQLKADGKTCKHLEDMLKYLRNYMEPRINNAMGKMERLDPFVSFEMLPLLLKPGIDAYHRLPTKFFYDSFAAVVIMKTEIYTPPGFSDGEKGQEALRVHLWYSECDGRTLGRETFDVYIPRYEGERQVTSVDIFPCVYLDESDGGRTRRAIIDRGRKAFQLMRAMPKQMKYSGYTYSKQMREYRGNCVIDTSSYLVHCVGDARTLGWNFLDYELTPNYFNSDMTSQNFEDFPFKDFHHIDLASTASLPTDRHYLLVSPFVPGLTLHDKNWQIFFVDLLEDVKPTVDMDKLVIDNVNRTIVQAITYAQANPVTFDHAHSKGEGQVILLHGSPGVGKTYTVECIAQSTGRPLISLTMGNIIYEGSDVDKELAKWFALSERWGAILLLDEADIFLEKRAQRDIQRNGVVSNFLRRMEYFRGLLFLTTNRVGQIDDAFLSRVSVVLQYNHLTDGVRKQIWKNFFHKLKDDANNGGKKIEVDRYAETYVLNDPEVKNLQWNGREIRNALQTAVSLASYKAIQEKPQGKESTEETIYVEEDHFRSVVSMSQKFKKYMSDISGRDEEGRAKARMERSDPRTNPPDA